MSVINPRNRLVNCRLSEVEYEALQAACHTKGARSLSEFARTAVLRLLDEPSAPDAPGGARGETIGRRVSDLELRVEQLLRLLTGVGVASLERNVSPPPAALPNDLQHY